MSLGLVPMHGLSSSSGWTALLPGLLIAGVGIGLSNPAIAHIALAVVPQNRSGMASGISNTFRIGGLATGVAALGAVFQHRLQTQLHALAPQGSGSLANAVASGGPKAAGRASLAHAARTAFVSGTNQMLLVGAVTVAVGAISAFAFVRTRDLAHHTASAPVPVPGE